MLTDSPRLKAKRLRKERPKLAVRHWHSDSVKIEAVKLWLVVGNLTVVAASLNLPYPTVRQWRYTKWWEELVQEIRTEKTLQLSNKLKTIAEKALDLTLDRLENGDWIYDQKSGQLRRKPVVMRDAMQVANSYLDRHSKLDEKPHQEEAQQQVQDRLLALAEAFTKMAAKTRKIDVLEVQ